MKFILKILVIFLIPIISKSQDTTGITEHGIISMNGNSTNVNGNKQLIFNSSLMNDLKYKNFNLFSFLNYVNINKNDLKISDDIVFRIQPRFIYHRWSFYNYEQFSSLYSRKIDFRFESFCGVGFVIINNKNFRTTFSNGIIYSKTKYIDDSQIELARNSSRLQIFGKFKMIGFSIEGFYQPEFSDISNVNYRWTIKLDTKITNKLLFTFNSSRIFESYNFSGIYPINDMLTFGLEYKY